MTLIGPYFFILGLVVASVTAQETSSVTSPNNFSSTVIPNDTIANNEITLNTNTTNTTTGANSTMPTTSSAMNITNTSSTIPPSTTKLTGDGGSTDGRTSKNTTPKMLSAGPSSKTTTKTTTKTATKNKDKSITAKPPLATSGDRTGIIILVVIVLVAFGFGVACFLARRRGRRYSVDFTSRPDEANIPLSTVEPEMPVDNAPVNGLQTFESAETTTKEPQEPEEKPEVQDEPKAEADKSVVEPSAESAALAPSPDSSEDKPKEDVVEPSPPAPVEPSPPAPAEPSVEEKTDDEGDVSNKTSVESLKETNENNSNNADFSQRRDSKLFWDVPLDCPV